MLTTQPEFFAALAALAAVRVALGLRRRLRDVVAVLTQQETDITDLGRDLDAATLRANDLARRLAWLESRARPAARGTHSEGLVDAARPRPEAPDTRAGAARDWLAPEGMTERRHRILTLARRGMRGTAIAETLGMPHGEVELIINLGRIG